MDRIILIIKIAFKTMPISEKEENLLALLEILLTNSPLLPLRAKIMFMGMPTILLILLKIIK